ncbi:2-amino-4-hydroxy-6-hydroxymethyldihydropteridine diphosphokinase [Corynebacterium aquilae]|uniref:2-amino-4-hydroxy-6- hydroxymethyldihydropteridine diphosphokinase n=1 Tax=Corynebacterium aquilae TaxID=203263 RepID=UPI000950CF1F|nr:2-amino-4-hydroxy-6-hydroxymethyldihydropteridine diphosphokinase [Corynebacterium aquilae]
MKAVLSLGSNIGDSAGHLARALNDFPGTISATSQIYATPPWGGVEQDDFLNITALVDFDGTPEQLLHAAQALEQAAQRRRDIRWGPRTLDVDIIDIPGYTSTAEHLTVPHPRAEQRLFVLIPWAEIDPTATLNGHKITDLINTFTPEERATIRAIGSLDNHTACDTRRERPRQ